MEGGSERARERGKDDCYTYSNILTCKDHLHFFMGQSLP